MVNMAGENLNYKRVIPSNVYYIPMWLIPARVPYFDQQCASMYMYSVLYCTVITSEYAIGIG